MYKDPTQQYLGNLSSDLKHIAVFLADDSWRIRLPRIKRFLVDFKNNYSATAISNQELRSFLENYITSDPEANPAQFAEDSLYLSTRLNNLANAA